MTLLREWIRTGRGDDLGYHSRGLTGEGPTHSSGREAWSPAISIEDRLIVRPAAISPRTDGDQEQTESAELVVLHGVDPLVQEEVRRAAKDQGERLGSRRPLLRG